MVAGAQRLLHELLARGVDSLADDAHLAGLECRVLLRPRDHEAVAHVPGCRGAAGEQGLLAGDVIGRRAAAATHDRDARVEHALHGTAVPLGVDVVERDAVLDVRQARVGLHHDGAARPRQHALGEGRHVLGTERAVDAHGVGAERRERDGGDLGRGAQEGPSVLVEGHGHEGGQVGVLEAGEKRRARLGEVGHRLDDEEVGTCGVRGADLLGKELVGVIKGKGAHWLEELPRRAEVRRHVARARGLRAGDGRREDLLDRGLPSELGAARAEGVGGHDLGASGDVGRMDPCDQVGIGEGEQLGGVARLEAERLELRAHGPVQKQELLPAEGGGKVVVLDAKRPRGKTPLGKRDVIHGRSFRWREWCRSRDRCSPSSWGATSGAGRRTSRPRR